MNIGPELQTIQQHKDTHNQAIANALQKLGQALSIVQLNFSQTLATAASTPAIPIQILNLSYAATINPIVTPNVQLQVWRVTITGNCFIAAPFGAAPGQHFILKITQGGTGNYAIAFAIPYGLLIAGGEWHPSGEVGQACIIEGYFITATELLITNLQGSI